MSVYLRSILDGNKVRLRALEGQTGIRTDINVQGSKEIRLSNPVGTIFECSSLTESTTFYRAVGKITIATMISIQHDHNIIKTNKIKTKNKPINILEIL